MREWIFKNRLTVILGAFVVALVAAMTQSLWIDSKWIWIRPLAFWTDVPWAPTTVLIGSGLLCLFAFGLRTAAEARLREVVYGQGETASLIKQGPFAWLRNPLYLGTWSFFSGAVALWTPVLIWAGLSLLFFFALDAMARHEETILIDQYGDEFKDYCRRVRRWLPWPHRLPRTSSPGLSDYSWAALGNLGLASLGLFRIAVAFDLPVRYIGPVNVICLVIWIAVVVSRRYDRTESEDKNR